MKQRKGVELTSNATETAHELGALLGLVGDDFENSTERTVVEGKPIEEELALLNLHLSLGVWVDEMATITLLLWSQVNYAFF